MQVHILTEHGLSPQLPAVVVPTAPYGELHPGSSRVPVCLHNLSASAVEIPTKAMVGQVVPANLSTTGGPPNQDYQRDV